MSYRIGPKELYVPILAEHAKIVEEDSDDSVTWYKNNYLDSPSVRASQISKACSMNELYNKNKNECANGDFPEENFLFYVCRHKSVKLVKFIVDHIDDKSSLNLIDSIFRQTAVSMAVVIFHKKTPTPNSEYQTICEKSYACTKRLLDGGANPNTFLSEETHMEGDFSQQNLIPSLAASVLINWTAMIEENMKNQDDENYKKNCLTYTNYLEKVFLLFYEYGTSITLCKDNTQFRNGAPIEQNSKPLRQITLCSEVDEGDTPFIKAILPKCVELIKHTHINAIWEKYRLIYLARKSKTSYFANFPEVTSLIGVAFSTLPLLPKKS